MSTEEMVAQGVRSALAADQDREELTALYRDNRPWQFWRVAGAPGISSQEWLAATTEAAGVLPGAGSAIREDPDAIAVHTLGEGQFGSRHWNLGPALSAYYSLKPYLPRFVTRPLRHAYTANTARHFKLGWPIEDRYVKFIEGSVRRLMMARRQRELEVIHLWPHQKRYALALTHDIEGTAGQNFVRNVAALEQRHGFRSCFNFVLGTYPLDMALMTELVERGFEVGCHGLRHDGKLYSSRGEFQRRAAILNPRMRELGMVGFRSPLTHRNPVWMQALDIEYDSSFFDTDPYEPIPGGTMSIWPFMIGRWVELPYTLAQDHTVNGSANDGTASVWLQKLDYLRRHCGLAMIDTHPDYLLEPGNFATYERFLEVAASDREHWHALPREIARWWRRRATATNLNELQDGSIARLRVSSNDLHLIVGDASPQITPGMEVS